MQQTNFTGHAQGAILLINPTGPTAIGSALQLELLGLHDGDILYIEMAASFSNSSGANRSISLSLDPNGDGPAVLASGTVANGPAHYRSESHRSNSHTPLRDGNKNTSRFLACTHSACRVQPPA